MIVCLVIIATMRDYLVVARGKGTRVSIRLISYETEIRFVGIFQYRGDYGIMHAFPPQEIILRG